MTDHAGKVRRFLELHHGEEPLLLPNPWDPGSARLLGWLGFKALATTSSGRGRPWRAGAPVLTARAENYLYGRPDLADTIARLQAYQDAGADVLYAPGVSDLAEIRQLVASVDRPVNVLARPGVPAVPELAAAGVARVSVGGAFAALGALVEAATELRDAGTYGFWAQAGAGSTAARAAFGGPPKR